MTIHRVFRLSMETIRHGSTGPRKQLHPRSTRRASARKPSCLSSNPSVVTGGRTMREDRVAEVRGHGHAKKHGLWPCYGDGLDYRSAVKARRSNAQCLTAIQLVPATYRARASKRARLEDEAVGNKSSIGDRQVSSASIVKEPWHAVSVVGASDACPSAVKLRARRFLPMDAPRLPTPDCAWPLQCKCIYRHYADRRASPRRASELGRPWRTVVPERRQIRGRRADD